MGYGAVRLAAMAAALSASQITNSLSEFFYLISFLKRCNSLLKETLALQARNLNKNCHNLKER